MRLADCWAVVEKHLADSTGVVDGEEVYVPDRGETFLARECGTNPPLMLDKISSHVRLMAQVAPDVESGDETEEDVFGFWMSLFEDYGRSREAAGLAKGMQDAQALVQDRVMEYERVLEEETGSPSTADTLVTIRNALSHQAELLRLEANKRFVAQARQRFIALDQAQHEAAEASSASTEGSDSDENEGP